MLNDKIKELLTVKNLSPSRFADEIGVQRSSISHILSGRNKPSLDVIQKINRRFPDLGATWFMEESQVTEEKARPLNPIETQSKEALLSRADKNVDSPINTITAPPEAATATGKRIEKILIFYTDKTFSEYRPEE